MEITPKTAVYYEDSPNHLVLAYVETVRFIQVATEWIQGKELAIITDLADEDSDFIEVMLTRKNVFALKSQVKKAAQFASKEVYSELPEGCLWRRTIFKSTPRRAQPRCICGDIVYPNSRTTQCRACKTVCHLECVSGEGCSKCGDQLPVVNRKERREVERRSPLRTSPEEGRKIRLSNLQVTKYPILSTKFATILQQHLDKLETESAKIRLTLSEIEIPRQIFRDKIFSALLLSQAECDSQESGIRLQAKEMLRIAIEVENAIFTFADLNVKNIEYTQKARMLAFNLLDAKNSEFRRNLLKGTISPESLPMMNSKDVASSSLKRHREAKEQELLKEKVLNPEIQQKVIAKSHKGEDMLQLSQSSIVRCAEVPCPTRKIPQKVIQEGSKSPLKRTESDLLAPNGGQIPAQKPDRKPWIPASIYEAVYENSPEKLIARLTRSFDTHLRPHQADKLKSHFS